MPWFAWVLIAVYAFGWLVYVVANEPCAGILWPLFFLGWLVSRPFR